MECMALTGKHLLVDGYNVIHEVVGQGSNANGTNLSDLIEVFAGRFSFRGNAEGVKRKI